MAKKEQQNPENPFEKEITFYAYTRDGQFFQAMAFYGAGSQRPKPSDLDEVRWYSTIDNAKKAFRRVKRTGTEQ